RPERGSPFPPVGRGMEKERRRRRFIPGEGPGFTETIPDFPLLCHQAVGREKSAGPLERQHGAGISGEASRRLRAEARTRETGGRCRVNPDLILSSPTMRSSAGSGGVPTARYGWAGG